MRTIRASFADKLYQEALHTLTAEGLEVAPRGQTTIELTPVTLHLEAPAYNIVSSPSRQASLGFMGAELLWLLLGRNDLGMVKFYNGEMARFSDDGVTLDGAYGPRLMPQFKYCYELLQRDPDSRQAVVSLWVPCPQPSKDIPCTTTLHFLRRGPYLHLQVYMRSNDAWLGLPYDLHNFTSLQLLMARLLGCHPGQYHHLVGSFHLYQAHLDRAMRYDYQPDSMELIKTPTPTAETWEQLQQDLGHAEAADALIRGLGPDVIGAKTDALVRHRCPFFDQKLGWMLGKARRKVSRV